MSRTLSNEENLNLGSDFMREVLYSRLFSISSHKMKSLLLSTLLAVALAEFFDGCP